MREKEQPIGKLGEAMANTASAALSTAAATDKLAAAAGRAGLAGGLIGAAGALYGAWQEWQDSRVQRLLREAYYENCADEGFAAYIDTLLREPRTRRLFLESVRTAFESVADEVLPAIAMLMREYERTGRDADAPFRGLCRVLQELSAEEFASFQALFRETAASEVIMASSGLAFARVRGPGRAAGSIIAAGTLPEDRLNVLRIQSANPEHFSHISHLLYINALGEKQGLGAVHLEDESTHDEIRVSFATARWVAGVVAPRTRRQG